MKTCSSQYRDAGGAKEIKNLGEQLMPRAKEIFSVSFRARVQLARQP
jgi:hypothetical protein